MYFSYIFPEIVEPHTAILAKFHTTHNALIRGSYKRSNAFASQCTIHICSIFHPVKFSLYTSVIPKKKDSENPRNSHAHIQKFCDLEILSSRSMLIEQRRKIYSCLRCLRRIARPGWCLTANMLTNSKTRVGASVLIYMEDERGSS